MPLFGRRLFQAPKDLPEENDREEIFRIEHTGEEFHSEEVYRKLTQVYGLERWTCECTWRASLTHGEAMKSERETRATLASLVPDHFHRPIFEVIHHSEFGDHPQGPAHLLSLLDVKPLEKLAEEVSIVLRYVVELPVRCNWTFILVKASFSENQFSSARRERRAGNCIFCCMSFSILLFSIKGTIERVEENDESRKRASVQAKLPSDKVNSRQVGHSRGLSFLRLANEECQIHRSTDRWRSKRWSRLSKWTAVSERQRAVCWSPCPSVCRRCQLIPNREKLKVFIRSYAIRLGNRADSPWIFYDASTPEKHQIPDRYPVATIEKFKKSMTVTLEVSDARFPAMSAIPLLRRSFVSKSDSSERKAKRSCRSATSSWTRFRSFSPTTKISRDCSLRRRRRRRERKRRRRLQPWSRRNLCFPSTRSSFPVPSCRSWRRSVVTVASTRSSSSALSFNALGRWTRSNVNVFPTSTGRSSRRSSLNWSWNDVWARWARKRRNSSSNRNAKNRSPSKISACPCSKPCPRPLPSRVVSLSRRTPSVTSWWSALFSPRRTRCSLSRCPTIFPKSLSNTCVPSGSIPCCTARRRRSSNTFSTSPNCWWSCCSKKTRTARRATSSRTTRTTTTSTWTWTAISSRSTPRNWPTFLSLRTPVRNWRVSISWKRRTNTIERSWRNLPDVKARISPSPIRSISFVCWSTRSPATMNWCRITSNTWIESWARHRVNGISSWPNDAKSTKKKRSRRSCNCRMANTTQFVPWSPRGLVTGRTTTRIDKRRRRCSSTRTERWMTIWRLFCNDDDRWSPCPKSWRRNESWKHRDNRSSRNDN